MFARIGLASGGVAVVALFVAGWLAFVSGEDDVVAMVDDDSPDMVQVEGAASDAALVPDRAALTRLRGDPLTLRLPDGDGGRQARRLDPPDTLRARTGGEAIEVVDVPLLTRAARVATALPSSREDFALFQAQRAEGLASLLDADDAPQDAVADPGRHLTGAAAEAAAGSWGVALDTGEAVSAVAFTETAIENTTSVVAILPEDRRAPLFSDVVNVVRVPQSLKDVLTLNGLDAEAARVLVTGLGRIEGLESGTALPLDPLPVGSVVAVRRSGGQVTQMSLYGPDRYAFSVAQVGAGRFAPAADPWLEDDLMGRSRAQRQEAAATTQVRLLDAVWGAALQGGLSGAATGELLVMLSQRFDLDRMAEAGDRLTLLHGPGEAASSVLYAGIARASDPMECFVVPTGAGYGCFDPDATVGVSALAAGMVTPVAGTRTSGFGPRMHPILKQLRNHDGVDWAAPTGTPVVAAMAGKVTVRGSDGGYGNVVYIDHPGGVQTRYAHLDRFAEDIAVGTPVTAGQKIGYVGTTGRSTGPHLHFELRVGGGAVDPLTFAGGGGGAVDALVNRIVQVESGGNAAAKNPLSTATGLGQFIESTWLRMMRSYRPDLASRMDRRALLALRTDPALSREMVRNLARESESYLRVRGHQVTPGRLYLAHFLGAEGADRSLRNAPDATVLAVMGAGVVAANPFLRGMTNGQMQAWADGKMRGGGAAPTAAAPRPAPVSPEVTAFIESVKELLAKL